MGCSYGSTNPLPHVTSVEKFIEDIKTIHPKNGKKFPAKNLI
jgi:hypothetical protein